MGGVEACLQAAHAKARVKAQAHGDNTKFGEANSAAPLEAQLPLDAQHEGAGGNILQHYHLDVEGIPEYINMLKDAQRQAGRAGRAISDETLLIFASLAMLTSKRFPRENDAWEDRAEVDKTWAAWKLAYKQAHAKA